MKNVRTILDQFLERYGKPPNEDMKSAGERVWKSVLSGEGARLDETSHLAPIRPVWRLRWPALATGIAAIVLAIVLPATVLRSAPAVFEDGAGSRNIQYGELVRSNGGGTLKFSDGARVEMRAESEVSFERSGDDVLLRVRKGDVIVNAAEQAKGQVHVETKDMSAVGNVFLVNAKEEGSRVAAITGETRVQQGATEKKLLPGEQVATNPGMGSLLTKEGIGWSRQAEAQLALLQQGVADPQPPPIVPVSRQEKFEAASIRLKPSVDGGRGNGPLGNACGNPKLSTQIDPRRLSIVGLSLNNLITLAYAEWAEQRADSGDFGCRGVTAGGMLSGGPGWVRSDLWEIQATFPEGPVDYKVTNPLEGLTIRRGPRQGQTLPAVTVVQDLGPRVRGMLQNLLADRFQLVLRPQTKDMPVYLLTVGKNGFKSNGNSRSGDPSQTAEYYGKIRVNAGYFRLEIGKMSMLKIANVLILDTERPILDRTNLDGTFDFHIEYDNNGTSDRPSLFKAIEEVGLKLEPSRAPVEVWVIERAEKPSEN